MIFRIMITWTNKNNVIVEALRLLSYAEYQNTFLLYFSLPNIFCLAFMSVVILAGLLLCLSDMEGIISFYIQMERGYSKFFESVGLASAQSLTDSKVLFTIIKLIANINAPIL